MSIRQLPGWGDVIEAHPGRRETADASRPGDVERIMIAVRAARETFEDPGMAAEWLESPCPSLGGVIPLLMLGTREGLDEVLRELVRIEHGIPP